ncbi:MAG: alanine racemase [Clostridia bacterium]|nr:alanine racemase [Clostridia bacterium]
MEDYFRRTWAEIDLDTAEHNYKVIRNCLADGIKLCCVVKADAYGHGSKELAALYEKLGADFFAVSNLEEAIELRRMSITLPILILGYTPAAYAKTLANNNITQAIVSSDYALELANSARDLGVTVNVHLKIDTGMSRIGIMCGNDNSKALTEALTVIALKGLNVTGMFTHFAVSDEKEEGRIYTENQIARFKGLAGELKRRGVVGDDFICHCANSAAIMDYPQAHMDMVRAGIILYGLAPSEKLKGQIDLRPAMAIKSVIAHIKTIEKGTTISYGRTFTAEHEMRIATVPIGYADGYIRSFGKEAYMIVGGKRAKVVGRICMDQCMIDVTDIDNVNIGDTVTVIGGGVSMDDAANWAGTINYEVACLVGKRVPRVYIQNREITSVNGLIS